MVEKDYLVEAEGLLTLLGTLDMTREEWSQQLALAQVCATLAVATELRAQRAPLARFAGTPPITVEGWNSSPRRAHRANGEGRLNDCA